MFSSYLCGGDCIDDVMDIKPFSDNCVCSSDVILRTLRNLSGDSVTYEGGRHYGVTSFQFYSMLPEMRLRLVVKRSQSRRDQADKDAARNLTGVAAALEAIEKKPLPGLYYSHFLRTARLVEEPQLGSMCVREASTGRFK